MCRLSSMTVRYGGEFTRSACDPFCISGETGSTRAKRFPVACLLAIRPGVANVTGNIPNGILSRQTCNDCDRSCPENFASRCQGNCSAVWPCNLATINTYQQYQQQYQKHTRTQGLSGLVHLQKACQASPASPARSPMESSAQRLHVQNYVSV